MSRLFLIDSSALAFRMYYAYAKNPLRNSKGQLVSLLHGYWGAILRIIKSHKPEYFAIVRDVSRKTFRTEIYPQYKANRGPTPEDMLQQLPYLTESLEKSGLAILEREGYEADDIMAFVAKRAAEKGCNVFMVTKDKDMAQVVNAQIFLYHIESGARGTEIGVEEVKKKFGVKPEQMIDYLSLVGDSSDNIPGVLKIGPKSAVDLLEKYGTLENIYDNLAQLPKAKKGLLEAGRENAFLSKELVTLKTDFDFGYKLEDLRYEGLKRNELFKLFNDYEVPSLIPLLPSVNETLSIFSLLPQEEKKVIAKSLDVINSSPCAVTILENAITVSQNENDFYYIEAQNLIEELFKKDIEFIFYNAKEVFHKYGYVKSSDVLLAQWLCSRRSSKPENAAQLLKMWKNAKEELKRKDLLELFETKEMPLLKCLFDMESAGVSIDNDALAKLSEEFKARIAEIENHVFEIAGENFNLASTKQLANILYEKLKLPVLKKNASGPSTDAETLEMLSEGANAHPIINLILNFRELQKLQNTYIETLPKLVSPQTGRLHTTFLPWGTATGRLSSINPNLQNIPVRTEDGKRIRAAFVPKEKGSKIISVDYSQIDLRMLAHLSGDKQLSNAFLQGKDVHSITAAKIFNTENISREMRAAAKVVNFGVIYGMSAFKLARDLHISRTQAAEFINGYFEFYSDVKSYFESIIKFAKENGFVETILKRRRYIPELSSGDKREQAMAERMAMNTPIQGSAADLISEAMLKIHSLNLPLKMILQVHDELIFECEASTAEELAAVIKKEMEHAIELSVPIVANVGIGDNWLEAH